jgi:2-polyprenyl-6-methoxyphenol hydroxylase-like FAD-dependent oxidoreductase
VLFKITDDEVLNLSSAKESRAFLKEEFPAMYPIMPDSEIDSFHTRSPGKLPTFRYVGPDLHYRDSAVLLGDMIHTVKPYFGLGVNSALEDVRVLWEKLQEHPVCSQS